MVWVARSRAFVHIRLDLAYKDFFETRNACSYLRLVCVSTSAPVQRRAGAEASFLKDRILAKGRR